MKIETLHTRPAPQQADPDAEILPMPVAGEDIGQAPVQAGGAPPAKPRSASRRGWTKVRATMTALPQRARQVQAQGAHYVAEKPFKTVMMAAAGGAALALILGAAGRRGRH
jgi:ElaB/YqjD/DUF883 family membrane-anchored ribosome-binding protein